jgi:hypothetical protein
VRAAVYRECFYDFGTPVVHILLSKSFSDT